MRATTPCDRHAAQEEEIETSSAQRTPTGGRSAFHVEEMVPDSSLPSSDDLHGLLYAGNLARSFLDRGHELKTAFCFSD